MWSGDYIRKREVICKLAAQFLHREQKRYLLKMNRSLLNRVSGNHKIKVILLITGDTGC